MDKGDRMFKKHRITKAEKREIQSRKRNRKKFLLTLRNIILSILVIVLIIVGIIFYNGYNLYKEAINNISIEDKIKEIKSTYNYVQIDAVSQYYKDAVVAVEDHRFYEHSGFDLITTINAAFNNVKTKSLGQGGSTITQQLAKNIYFTQEKKFTRKVAELFMSFDLESKLSKDEILELYINIIYFGDGYYGIKEASNGYYNKEPIDLTLEEAIMIAGLPAAPSVYSPTVNEKLANERYKQVEAAMFKYGYIEKESD